MNVLLVASEAAPLISTSGVANVVTELCMQLRRDHCDARIILPWYRHLKPAGVLTTVIGEFDVPVGATSSKAKLSRMDYRIQSGSETSVPVYLIGDPFYFDRENPYGYADDYERFIFFTRAVLEALRRPEFQQEQWMPEVIHGHEWVAGLIPLWIRTLYRNDAVLGPLASVFTIHNAGFSGQFSSRSVGLAGLEDLGIFKSIGETNHRINFMGRGILAADAVSTVSPGYAQEIQSGAHARELHQVLGGSPGAVTGILNGVDEALYTPYLDQRIHVQFGAANLEQRKGNKAFLQEHCGLEANPEIPLFAMVSRLIAEKGTGLVEEVLPEFLERSEAQFVLLGQPGDYRSREALARIQTRFPRGMAAYFAHDDTLARQIFAGSDVVMKPSLTEPCGLQQMLAMRYGALPLVRRTGGLADTVAPCDAPASASQGSGFVFEEFSAAGLRGAMREAVDLYHGDPQKWRELQRRNMKVDFSWERPAREYVKLYERALSAATSRGGLPPGAPLVRNRDELLAQTVLAANELAETSMTDVYLGHVAEAARELLGFDGLLIWSVDAERPHLLRLSAASPASVTADTVSLTQDHSDRSWSREYVFRVGDGESPSVGLKTQLGFLTSDLAKRQGWESQLTVPIGAGGTIGGRIDAFSVDAKRSFDEWEITALTVIGAAVGLNLQCRRMEAKSAELLEADRQMMEARSVNDLADVVLRSAGRICSADIAILRIRREGDFILREGSVSRQEAGFFHLDRAQNSFCVPLSGDVALTAVLEVARSHGLPISREHEGALRRLALQAGPALQAALRREEDERKRVAQLRDLAESLVAGGDYRNLLQRVTETTAEVLHAKAASLYLVNDAGDRLEIRAAYGYHKPILDSHEAGKRVSYSKGVGTTGWLWETGRKFKADSLNELHSLTPHAGKYKGLQEDREPDAFMGLPMKVRALSAEKVIGVLKFEDRLQQAGDSRSAFTEEEFLLAEMMANIVGTVLYNVQLSGAQLQKLSRDLGELSATLAGAQDIKGGLVQAVVQKIAETLKAGAASVYLFDATKGVLEIVAATGYQADLVRQNAFYTPDEGITGWIFKYGETVLANSPNQLKSHAAHAGKFDKFQGRRPPNSFLGLPLTVVDRFSKKPKTIGVLKVEDIEAQEDHPEAYFTEEDGRLVGMMANVIATVVYNTQVSVAGLQELTDDLARLSDSLAGGKDLEALVEAVVETTAEVLGAQASSLYLWDAKRQVLAIKAATGYQKGLVKNHATYKSGEGITGWIFQEGKRVLANSLEGLRSHPAHKGLQDPGQGGRKPSAFLGVPLRVAGLVIGVLKVEDISASTNHPEKFFTGQDEALVTMMASVIAAVVYNTQVGDEQLQRFGANLQELSTVMARRQEIGELVNKVVETIAGVLGAEAASLYLFDDATNRLVIRAATGYQEKLVDLGATYAPGEGITGWIFREGKEVLANTLEALRSHPAHKGKQDAKQGGRKPSAFLGVPLHVAERVIGVLKVENIRASLSHPEERFTEQDVWLVTMMANVIATVVSVTREGEARTGKILRRLGTLSEPADIAQKLLAEYAHRADEGTIDQMAIALAAHLDASPKQVDAEAEALFRAHANHTLFRRVAERAKKGPVAYRMGVYYDVIHCGSDLKTWQQVLDRAIPWFDLRARAGSPRPFADACKRIAGDLAGAAGLKMEEQFLDKKKLWYCACLSTEGSFGEQVKKIPIFFPRGQQFDEALRDALEGALHKQLTFGPSVIQLVLWQQFPKLDQIEKLRKRLKLVGQDLVISNKTDAIRITAFRKPIDEYRKLIFLQASAPLLFVTQGGVPDNMFFGREKQLKTIMEQVRADRSCMVIGGRKYGKTSILERLQRVDLPREGYTGVYLDARLAESSEEKFLNAPLRGWHPAPPKQAPRTVGELLSHPPPKVVLLLDEPDALIASDRGNGWHLFNRLRALVNEKSLRIVLCGEKQLRRAATEDAEGPFVNFSQRVDVGPLDRAEAEALITEPFAFINVELINATAIVDRIYQFTNGHPSVIQRICKRLVEAINRKESDGGTMSRQITLTDLGGVLGDVDFLDDDFLAVYWDRAGHLERLVSLLMARNPDLRHANQVHAEVLAVCRNISLKETRSALKDLVQLRAILRHTTHAYEFVLTSFPQVARMEFVDSILEVAKEEVQKEYAC